MYEAAIKVIKLNTFRTGVKSKVSNEKKSTLNCKIVINEERNGFNPGSEIKGHVQVTYNEKFAFHGLKLVLEGSTYAKYRENDRSYEKHDHFLTESIYIVGGGVIGKRKLHSEAGTISKYQFALTIPSSDIPGSFHSEFGFVVYHLILYLDYGDNRLVKKSIKQFKINPKIDLDPDDTYNSTPITFEKSYKRKAHQSSHSKKKKSEAELKFVLSLPQGGYILGENLKFKLELDNPKNQFQMTRVLLALIQRVTYHGGKFSSKIINVVQTSAVCPKSILDFVPDSNADQGWNGSLKIPEKLVPTQNGTIGFEYFLKVSISMKNIELLSGECPITIGVTRKKLSAYLKPKSSYITENGCSPFDSESESESESGESDADLN